MADITDVPVIIIGGEVADSPFHPSSQTMGLITIYASGTKQPRLYPRRTISISVQWKSFDTIIWQIKKSAPSHQFSHAVWATSLGGSES